MRGLDESRRDRQVFGRSWAVQLRASLLTRLPEGCGILWLTLLAGAVWIHTHASQQPPIYDGFAYYEKAYNFWMAIRTGKWFNPLDLEPTYRPPGTVVMSYPAGFDPDPRAFYFRSVYFPGVLLFSSVLIAVYRVQGEVRLRWRAILTAIFFTTMTLVYHFEFDTSNNEYGYWGLVDSFLTGVAAVAAASVWRGTRRDSKVLVWAACVSLASALSILVKPAGALVAAAAGLAWVGFALSTLIEIHLPFRQKRKLSLTLRFAAGTGMIGLVDMLVITAAMQSSYLSRGNLAYGQRALAIAKADFHVPFSWSLLQLLTGSVGIQFLLWGMWVVAILAMAFSAKKVAATATHVASGIASLITFLFGIWFWIVTSGKDVRYAVPFLMMAAVWLLPTVMQVWDLSPSLLRLLVYGLLIVAPLNLALILLVARPSLAWQKLSGVSITDEFPSQVFAAFKRLIGDPSGRPMSVYVMSFDANDANLDALMNEANLIRFHSSVLSLRRPVDFISRSTFRTQEIASANLLLVNPGQAQQVAAGQVINDLKQERGVFTAWADGLTVADGVSVYLATPSARILKVVDSTRLRASLDRLVTSHAWNPVFASANHLVRH